MSNTTSTMADTAAAIRELDAFEKAYLTCALWSSTGDEGEPLDDDYGIEDISEESLRKMLADCRDFREANRELLAQSGLRDENAGHDFWLTRNRHGAGFWDLGLGDIGQALTDAAHSYGEVYLYVGDDGKIHCA